MELEIRQQYIIKASMTMLFLKGNSDKNYFYLFLHLFVRQAVANEYFIFHIENQRFTITFSTTGYCKNDKKPSGNNFVVFYFPQA